MCRDATAVRLWVGYVFEISEEFLSVVGLEKSDITEAVVMSPVPKV